MFRRIVPLLVFAVLVSALPAAAGAATVTPTRFDDPGGAGSCPSDCSLRQAIAFASPSDTIQLPAGTYTLSQGTPLQLNKVLTLDGAGARSTTIDADDTSGVISNLSVGNISDLTIANGRVTTGGSGGGVINTGTLGLERVAVTSNIVQQNGFVEGGGIGNQGTLVMVNSSVTHNFVNSLDGSSARGGGIFNYSGSSTYIANSTLSDDFTLGAGSGGGGAIGATSGAGVYLYNVTLGSNNSVTPSQQGGQILGQGGSNIQLRNTVIALGGGPSGTESCSISGTLTSFGGNVDQTSQCGLATLTGDKVGIDPQLGTLGDHGGPTETQMPAPTSPAVDFGTADGCAYTSPDVAGGDQRGGKRTVGASCDSGAVERNSLAQLSITGALGPARYPLVPATLTVTNNGPDDATGVMIQGPFGVSPGGLVCSLGTVQAGGSGTCSRSDLPWNGDSVLSLIYTAAADVNAPLGAQGSVTLTTLAPRLSSVSLRPPKVTPTRRGATLGTKKISGAAVVKYKGVDLSGLLVPIQAPVKGNLKGGKCVKVRPGKKAVGRKCTLWKTLTTVKLKNAKTSGTLYFTGRIKNRAMKKGKYRFGLTATSKDGGVGSPWYLSFSVK